MRDPGQSGPPTARATRGSTLVEALVALVLMGLAGSVLASAALTALRATKRAWSLAQLTTVAARELAIAEARGPTIGIDEGPMRAPGLDPRTTRRVEVRADGDNLVSLNVRVVAPGTAPVELHTCMLNDD